MSSVAAQRYHEILDQVEREHWWFRSLRDFVGDAVTANVAPGSRVLDVGCSTGHVIGALPDEYERTGADISASAIELARELRPGIEFVAASVEELPFADESFDCVIAMDVVSAVGVDDDRRALGEIRRVLRPGGVLLIQVAAYEWLRSGYDEAAGTARRYTAGSVRELLEGGGFRIAHLTHRITILFPLAAIRRLLEGDRGIEDLKVPRPRLNRLLARVTGLEGRIARRARLPFGLSVFAIAVVDGDPGRGIRT